MVCVATAGVVCYLSCGGFTGCDGSIGIIVWRSALFWGSIRLIDKKNYFKPVQSGLFELAE